MFQFFNRAKFISRHAPMYAQLYHGSIAEDHKELIIKNWPANEFVDWYMETAQEAFKTGSYSNYSQIEFCQFMNWMRGWVCENSADSLDQLYKFTAHHMRTQRREKLFKWLEIMNIESKKYQSERSQQNKELATACFDPQIPDIGHMTPKETFEINDYRALYFANVNPLSAKYLPSNVKYINTLVVFNRERLPVLYINYEHNTFSKTFALCSLEGDGSRKNYGRDDSFLEKDNFLKAAFSLLEEIYGIKFNVSGSIAISEKGGFAGNAIHNLIDLKNSEKDFSDGHKSESISEHPSLEENSDEIIIPDEILSLKGLEKLDVPKRIMLKKFFKKSNQISQVAAMKHIFGVSDTEATVIATDIKRAFEQYDFVPWPAKAH
jgi:hypothetical protein